MLCQIDVVSEATVSRWLHVRHVSCDIVDVMNDCGCDTSLPGQSRDLDLTLKRIISGSC